MSETDPNHLCLTDTRFDLKPSPEAINRGMLPARLMRGYNWPGQELLMVTPAAVELDNRGYAPDDSYISFHISKSGVLGVLDEGSRRLLTDEFGCVNIEIVGE